MIAPGLRSADLVAALQLGEWLCQRLHLPPPAIGFGACVEGAGAIYDPDTGRITLDCAQMDRLGAPSFATLAGYIIHEVAHHYGGLHTATHTAPGWVAAVRAICEAMGVQPDAQPGPGWPMDSASPIWEAIYALEPVH